MYLLAQPTETIPEVLWKLATPTAVMWYVYFLAGIGFYGGYKYWRFFGRALYWLVFPVHAGVCTGALLLAVYVRLSSHNVRYLTAPCIFLVIVVIAYAIMGPLGTIPGAVLGMIFGYRHLKSGKS